MDGKDKCMDRVLAEEMIYSQDMYRRDGILTGSGKRISDSVLIGH